MPVAHAVFIAVPVVDTRARAYQGTKLEKLCGSANDVRAMRGLLQNVGFNVNLQAFGTNGAGPADKKGVLRGVDDAVQASQPDDLVVIYFTGHGTRVNIRFNNGSATEDTAWCLHDTVLAWQELLKAILTPQQDVRVLVVADCCHASPPIGKPRNLSKWFSNVIVKSVTKNDEQQIKDNVGVIHIGPVPANSPASVLFFAACGNNQVTVERNCRGTFTSTLAGSYGKGRLNDNYQQLCSRLAARFSTSQHPQVTQQHTGNNALNVNSIAFQ
jgi:hypothetical protein